MSKTGPSPRDVKSKAKKLKFRELGIAVWRVEMTAAKGKLRSAQSGSAVSARNDYRYGEILPY
jgi:hypothetical protein